MRRTLLLGSVAAVAGSVMVGCGGSSSGTNLNNATRIVVGYVYVRQNNWPQATPTVIVSSSSIAPNGYAAPDAGTVTMTVPDGTITRSEDSESFNMSTSNAIVARVYSQSSGDPTFSLEFSGLQLSGEAKVDNSTPSFDITGTDNTIFPISFNSPTYTVGAASSIKVLIKDPSTLYGADEQFRFGAPADVIGTASGDAGLCPSSSAGDRYDVAVVLLDANGVVIPGTTFSVADASSDGPTAAAVTQSGSQLVVAGGGTQGANVDLTFTSPQAPGLSTTYSTVYSYGNTANFGATFSAPSDPASVTWTVAPATGSVAVNFNLNNGRGVAVPNRGVSFQTRDARTSGTPAVFSGNNYPGPAAGSPLSATGTTTDASGNGTVTFSAPTAAAGNSAFNGLNIKYGTGCKVDVIAGSTIVGTKVVTVNRPLNALVIQGASRLDTNTASQTSGSNSFAVTGATDVDTQAIPAPVGTYSWTLTPNSAGNIGDPDNVSARSIAAPTINGSSTGSAIQILAGANSGAFDVYASFGSVSSNVVSTAVFGPPSKILVSPTPGAGGLTGTAASAQTLTLTFLDGFGHDVTSETTVTGKSGSLSSSTGGTFTFPSAPSRQYNLTFPTSSGTAIATMGVTLNWQGAGQGTSVGSASGLNISRTMNVVVP